MADYLVGTGILVEHPSGVPVRTIFYSVVTRAALLARRADAEAKCTGCSTDSPNCRSPG